MACTGRAAPRRKFCGRREPTLLDEYMERAVELALGSSAAKEARAKQSCELDPIAVYFSFATLRRRKHYIASQMKHWVSYPYPHVQYVTKARQPKIRICPISVPACVASRVSIPWWCSSSYSLPIAQDFEVTPIRKTRAGHLP